MTVNLVTFPCPKTYNYELISVQSIGCDIFIGFKRRNLNQRIQESTRKITFEQIPHNLFVINPLQHQYLT